MEVRVLSWAPSVKIDTDSTQFFRCFSHLPVEGSKGGAGKTTLASAIAVRPAEESKRVALIDADPQNSLYRWWGTAGPGNPAIYEADATSEAIELLISEGWEWVIIDTPGELFDRIENAVALADFVLIPARASAPGTRGRRRSCRCLQGAQGSRSGSC